MKSAERWTAELKAWKESLPAFLEPTKVDPSILVPIFQRQSTVLRLAYAHALTLANRPSLLNNFGDLSRRQGLPQKETEGSLRECIDAAILVVDTVNGFIEEGKMCKAFWFTHYISFCAIATLYVYTVQQSIPPDQGNNEQDGTHSTSIGRSKGAPSHSLHTQYFEAAEKCQRSIAQTTAKTSPFRRYNIILDELKSEVVQRLGITTVSNSSAATFMNGRIQGQVRSHNMVDGSERMSLRTPTSSAMYAPEHASLPGDAYHANHMEVLPQQEYPPNPTFDFRSSSNTPAQLFGDSMFDSDLFGPQGELMGWSEFDSCVSTCTKCLHRVSENEF